VRQPRDKTTATGVKAGAGATGAAKTEVLDRRTITWARPDSRKRARRLSLSVVIPTLNASETLPNTIATFATASRRGIDLDIVVTDSGSTDSTARIAAELGARVIQAERGRGQQLIAGAKAARGEWLLFLHADTVLGRGWDAAVMVFTSDERNRERAAVFSFALNDPAPAARRLERLVRWRNNWLGLPYGDQGLLIHRCFYSRLGGYKALPLMEDVELVRRIGMARFALFDVRAITSPARYRQAGYISRIVRNFICLSLFFLRLPPRWIAKLYG
jgi:rSAM/selenodomain-associated transferase 2